MCTEPEFPKGAKQAAIWITILLGVIMLVMATIFTVNFLTNLPKPPSLEIIPPGTVDEKAREITNYKDLTNAMQANANNVYEIIVNKTIQPIFNSLLAAVIAYVFAKQTGGAIRAYFESKKRNG